jgi:hypothetical protein
LLPPLSRAGIFFGRVVHNYKQLCLLNSVCPQMVDLGSEQGLSNFETAGASEANAHRGA